MAGTSAHHLEIRSHLSPDECVRRIADGLERPRVIHSGKTLIRQNPTVKGSVSMERLHLTYDQRMPESPTFFEGTITPAPDGGSIIQGTLSTCRGSRIAFILTRTFVGMLSLLMLCGAGLAIHQIGPTPGLVLFVCINLLFAAGMSALGRFITSPSPAHISDFIREALEHPSSQRSER